MHDGVQLWVPQSPQDRVAPGVHVPVGHVLHVPQVQASEHVRVCVPQVQARVSTALAQHSEPSSQVVSQSSSTPLHDSAGGVQASGAGGVQAIEQAPEPVEPQVVVQLTIAPTAQSESSSVAPSQSSSAPLHVSGPGPTQAPAQHVPSRHAVPSATGADAHVPSGRQS